MNVERQTPRSSNRSNPTNEHVNPSDISKRSAITLITDYIAVGIFKGLSLLFGLFGYKNLHNSDDDLPSSIQRHKLHKLNNQNSNLLKKIESLKNHGKKRENNLKDKLAAVKTELEQMHRSLDALNLGNRNLHMSYQCKLEEVDKRDNEIKELKHQLKESIEDKNYYRILSKWGGDKTPTRVLSSSEQSESLAEKMSRYTDSQHEGSPGSNHQNDPESFAGLGVVENGDATD